MITTARKFSKGDRVFMWFKSPDKPWRIEAMQVIRRTPQRYHVRGSWGGGFVFEEDLFATEADALAHPKSLE